MLPSMTTIILAPACLRRSSSTHNGVPVTGAPKPHISRFTGHLTSLLSFFPLFTEMQRLAVTPALRRARRPVPATAMALFAVGGGAVVRATHQQLRWNSGRRRVIRPTEEGVADLMEDEDDITSPLSGGGGGGHPAPLAGHATLSSLAASVSSYKSVVKGEKQEEGKRAPGQQQQQQQRASGESVADSADALDGQAGSGSAAEPDEGAEAEGDIDADEEAAQQRILEQQQYYYELPVDELTVAAVTYLRATENIALVSPEEEHVLFPVLLERMQEFHVMQLLDVVDCHWGRSTMLRYGTTYKDAVRDRIAQLATAAAAQLEAKKRSPPEQQPPQQQQQQQEEESDSRGDDARSGWGEGRDKAADVDEDSAVFVAEKEASAAQRAADAVLTRAHEEITAETIYRAIIVMGMSAGRRKRDLAFFQLLGNYFAFFINDYRDPHQLVRVLTAMARAKIVPAPAFLNLIARRMPVLHKRTPLEPLPAYRALSNFARMHHTSMNTFRFLADCMASHVEKHVREEKKQRRAAAAGTAEADVTAAAENAQGAAAAVATDKHRPEIVAKERLRRMSGLRPSMFTRWLYVLARLKAPHQQYLRPLIKPVILPLLPYLPPPSFTRLLTATRVFRSTDSVLIDALVGHACDTLAPAGKLTTTDVLELLQLLAIPDTPVPAQLDRFLGVCKDNLCSTTAPAAGGEGGVAATAATPTTATPSPRARGTVTVVMRPREMCRVMSIVGGLQRRDEIPLEALTPLLALVDDFAQRLTLLMRLGVAALGQVDEFIELCERHQIPDTTGAVEQLTAERYAGPARARRAAAGEDAEAATSDSGPVDDLDVEEAYYNQTDIDVRETFHRILLTNSWNTFGGYRPLPGALQVDFREELTKISAFELLQAVDLFATANPGALKVAPRLFLSRSLLEKLGKEGEVVVEEELNRLVIRQPRAEVLTRADLETFTQLLQRTPLEAVRRSPVAWTFVKEKAERLGLGAVAQTADAQLRAAHA